MLKRQPLARAYWEVNMCGGSKPKSITNFANEAFMAPLKLSNPRDQINPKRLAKKSRTVLGKEGLTGTAVNTTKTLLGE